MDGHAPSTPSPRQPVTSGERAVDLDAFARDVDALRCELEAELGPDDLAHLRKLARWGRAATTLGYATSWMGPNLLSAGLLSLGSTARWTIVAHHVSHKGLDAIAETPEHLTSGGFARGARRLVDWLDWLDPEAWAFEHNVQHHFRTGETADPDLVEHNMRVVRDADWPKLTKLGIVAFYACTWRLTYYAPNTFQVLWRATRDRKARRAHDERRDGEEALTSEERFFTAFDPRTEVGRGFLRSIAPYVGLRFVLPPLAALGLGPAASASVLANTLLAELLTNLHTFVLIAPNHAGSDLFRFDERPRGRADLFARQVLGSANYTGGSDVADFLQGFLNYQVEHHLFPELPPLALRRAQPRVQALCEKHGLPYVRERIDRRVRRLIDVMIGQTSMLRAKDARAAVAKPA